MPRENIDVDWCKAKWILQMGPMYVGGNIKLCRVMYDTHTSSCRPFSVDRGHAKYVDGDNDQVQMLLQCTCIKVRNHNNNFLTANATRKSNLPSLSFFSHLHYWSRSD